MPRYLLATPRCLPPQVRLRAYEWLLWMDADTLIMDPAQQA